MTPEPLISGEDKSSDQPATPDSGDKTEGPAGRRPQPAVPVIALRMEALLTWTAERVAKFPRDHKFTVGDRLLETCLNVMAALTDAAYRLDKREVLISAQPSASQASGSSLSENSSGRGGVLAYAAASRSDAASMR